MAATPRRKRLKRNSRRRMAKVDLRGPGKHHSMQEETKPWAARSARIPAVLDVWRRLSPRVVRSMLGEYSRFSLRFVRQTCGEQEEARRGGRWYWSGPQPDLGYPWWRLVRRKTAVEYCKARALDLESYAASRGCYGSGARRQAFSEAS